MKRPMDEVLFIIIGHWIGIAIRISVAVTIGFYVVKWLSK